MSAMNEKDPRAKARIALPMICRALDFAEDLGEDSFSHDLHEFAPGHWQYGLHVACVLVVQDDGSIRDYGDQSAEDFDPSDSYIPYPSLEAWAGAVLIYTAEGCDHLNGSTPD